MENENFDKESLTFCVEYRFNDRTFTVHILADSFDDAMARLTAVAESGKVVGEVVPGKGA